MKAAPRHVHGTPPSLGRFCRSPRTTARRWLAGAVLVVAVTAAVPAVAAAGDGDTARSALRVHRLASRLGEIVDHEALWDTLHFGWFDHPATRATLAVLVKTTATLKRELSMRELRNGALSDARLEEVLSWAEKALMQVVSTSPPERDFPRTRVRVTTDDFRYGAIGTTLFAFTDRSTITRSDERFGDLDLLAAMGFHVYARAPRIGPGRDAASILTRRASALGIAAVLVEAPWQPSGSLANAPADDLVIVPAPLSTLLAGATSTRGGSDTLTALYDRVGSEPWSGWLARRALARGISGRSRYVVVDWQEPSFTARGSREVASVRAAMWVSALEGNAVNILPGWRDLRDGSASPHGSVFSRPERMEAIAHTALELASFAEHLRRFDVAATLALSLGPDAVAVDDMNAWADWLKPILSGLCERQIAFDVIRRGGATRHTLRDAESGRTGTAGRYPVVIPVQREDAFDVPALILRIERRLAGISRSARRITLRESNGATASHVYVRVGSTEAGLPCVAVVNLSDMPRHLRLDGWHAAEAATDVLSGEVINQPGKSVRLEAWQVRLLGPH